MVINKDTNVILGDNAMDLVCDVRYEIGTFSSVTGD